jgi:hypothetical protein
MESQQKILMAVTIALVVFAIYLVFTTIPAPAAKPPDTTAAESILQKAVLFGKGLETYSYSFSETSNGYTTTYTLLKNGDEKEATIKNPLSTKNIYYLKNDTILCISYAGQDACSSVAGNAQMANYLSSISFKYFNDTIISRNEMDTGYLLKKGYIMLDPAVTKKTFGIHGCDAIGYVLDMTNISVDDAARFGVGSTTPRIFDWRMCVDNQTGYLYDRSFNYTYNGISYLSEFRLLSFNPGASAVISPPENLTGDAVALLFTEREQQVKLASCVTDKKGDERDKCVAAVALDLRRTDICSMAGGRKDRCLVSLVPLTKDKAICDMVTDPSFKDDCIIELAGAYKDKTYCINVKDPGKTPLCEQAATPEPPKPPAQQNQTDGTANSTSTQAGNASSGKTGMDANAFLNYIDKIDRNTTTNASVNGTG